MLASIKPRHNDFILALKSFDISLANALKSKFLSGLVGFPSVSTIITFGLSGLSPPASVNISSLAIRRAISVRVWYCRTIGSSAIFCNRASLSWYCELPSVKDSCAFLLKVIRPKWSASGAGWKLPTSLPKKVITFARLPNLTLWDLSRTIATSSPAVHGGAVEMKKWNNLKKDVKCQQWYLSHEATSEHCYKSLFLVL